MHSKPRRCGGVFPYQRRCYSCDADLLDWKGCTMVNVACPDDVCFRQGGHRGGHQLGSWPWGEHTAAKYPMLPAGTSLEQIVEAGADDQ